MKKIVATILLLSLFLPIFGEIYTFESAFASVEHGSTWLLGILGTGTSHNDGFADITIYRSHDYGERIVSKQNIMVSIRSTGADIIDVQWKKEGDVGTDIVYLKVFNVDNKAHLYLIAEDFSDFQVSVVTRHYYSHEARMQALPTNGILVADTSQPGNMRQEVGQLITSSFGIGTSTPDSEAELEINQNADTFFYIDNPNSGNAARSGLRAFNSNGALNLYAAGSNYTGVAGFANKAIIGSDSGLNGFIFYNGDAADMEFHPTGYSNGAPNVVFKSNGRVGISTTTPFEALQIGSGFTFHNGGHKVLGFGTGTSGGSVLYPGHPAEIRWAPESGLVFRVDPNQRSIGDTSTYPEYNLVIASNGRVGIGTPTPGHKLSVNGTIAAKEIIVTNTITAQEIRVTDTNWADFVFADDYQLASLSEVKDYISSFGHLPDIPSAEQVAAEGVGLAEMNTRLLQKVEELTLYAIEQEESIHEYKDQLEAQREVNTSQEERIARLEAVLQTLLEKSGN